MAASDPGAEGDSEEEGIPDDEEGADEEIDYDPEIVEDTRKGEEVRRRRRQPAAQWLSPASPRLPEIAFRDAQANQ